MEKCFVALGYYTASNVFNKDIFIVRLQHEFQTQIVKSPVNFTSDTRLCVKDNVIYMSNSGSKEDEVNALTPHEKGFKATTVIKHGAQRTGMDLVAGNRSLYLIGGRGESGMLGNVGMIDLKNKEYKDVGSLCHEVGYASTLFDSLGNILVLGGYGRLVPVHHVQSFSPDSFTCKVLKPLSRSPLAHGKVLCGDKVIFLSNRSAFIYDLATGESVIRNDFSTPNDSSAVVQYKNDILAIGGGEEVGVCRYAYSTDICTIKTEAILKGEPVAQWRKLKKSLAMPAGFTNGCTVVNLPSAMF